MRDVPPADCFMAWIAQLRARCERGDLARLSPIDFGDGLPALPAEHTVLLMLADLDDFRDLAPDEASDPFNVARRASLLADFHVLRFLVDWRLPLSVLPAARPRPHSPHPEQARSERHDQQHGADHQDECGNLRFFALAHLNYAGGVQGPHGRAALRTSIAVAALTAA